MLNKNTLDAKKYEANEKQHCQQAGATKLLSVKALISAEAKEVQIFLDFLNDIQ